jgi:hypothetical protein
MHPAGGHLPLTGGIGENLDHTEYELLCRVEAGKEPFMPADTVGSPSLLSNTQSLEYAVARLLQLRARGLVRFPAVLNGDYYLAGPCRITPHGRAMLKLHRLSASEAPAATRIKEGESG